MNAMHVCVPAAHVVLCVVTVSVAQFIDDRNIRWEQHELINMSEEMDEKRSDEDQGDQQEEDENIVASMLVRTNLQPAVQTQHVMQ
jgi:hypothetical protein